ncbi:sugar phosphate isomerase/epimerase family protein [Subtercola frigoramans]|uniref:Inosose dehydratase n=1 Tax=Subtercola frigoramans TaxID=120298 RepID=A0ABS2L992_9MICO|nr:sugar phosphate isomerase/epimerase [Subtercola frigoramans]MBM7473672.1 inosose dehydratase [Subtercola frigoramans]
MSGGLSRQVAICPLPWIREGRERFDNSHSNVERALSDHHAMGYAFVAFGLPDETGESEYRELLDRYSFAPAPGYYSSFFESDDRARENEEVRRVAALHSRFGLTDVFVASSLPPERRRKPAVGHLADADRLLRIADRLSEVAGIFAESGVTAALHPHVASWIETEDEIRAVLDATEGSELAFGPDVGHLFWAGADSVALVKDYRRRIRGIHLKDVCRSAVAAARFASADYSTATADYGIWMEPGRGDVPLDGIFVELGSDFDGWFIIEIDVPHLPDRFDSSAAALQFVTTHPYFRVGSS